MADYSNAIAAGDAAKMRSFLTASTMLYGPSPADSSSGEQDVKNWEEDRFKKTIDRKIAFVQRTFKVFQGNLAGNWVSQWGDFSFTQDGKTVKFPYQNTSRIENGKIVSTRIYYDRQYISTQLGYKLTPPEPAEK